MNWARHPDGWVVFLPVVDTPKFNHEDQIDSFVPIQILRSNQWEPQVRQGQGFNGGGSGHGPAGRGQNGSPGPAQTGAIRSGPEDRPSLEPENGPPGPNRGRGFSGPIHPSR